MNTSYRKTFLAGAVAVLISAPAFAAEGTQHEGESMPGKTGTEKPVTEKSMDAEPKIGGKSMGMTTKTQAKGDNPIYSRSADELNGTEVVDSAGDNVGTIERVVLMRDSHSAHAVISTGGILGIGERNIVVSLDELNVAGEALQLNITNEQIQARNEYQSEKYVELKSDKPIRVEFSAFEPEDDSLGQELVPEAPESAQ